MSKLPNIDINTTIVRNALGETTNNVGKLCSSIKINHFSINKPVRYAADVYQPGTLSGLQILKNGDINLITYDPPIGGASGPYRLGDFRGYDHNTPIPALSTPVVEYQLSDPDVPELGTITEDLVNFKTLYNKLKQEQNKKHALDKFLFIKESDNSRYISGTLVPASGSETIPNVGTFAVAANASNVVNLINETRYKGYFYSSVSGTESMSGDSYMLVTDRLNPSVNNLKVTIKTTIEGGSHSNISTGESFKGFCVLTSMNYTIRPGIASDNPLFTNDQIALTWMLPGSSSIYIYIILKEPLDAALVDDIKRYTSLIGSDSTKKYYLSAWLAKDEAHNGADLVSGEHLREPDIVKGGVSVVYWDQFEYTEGVTHGTTDAILKWATGKPAISFTCNYLPSGPWPSQAWPGIAVDISKMNQ